MRSGRITNCLLAVAAGAAVMSAPIGVREVQATTDCERCFAMVNADGTLRRGRNVVSTARTGVGEFTVLFRYPINRCTVSATIDSLIVGVGVTAGSIALDRRSNKQVAVFTTLVQRSIDQPFNLRVAC